MQKDLFDNYVSIAMTNTGYVRQHNEDSVLNDENLGLFLVADGMGGHEAGEIASQEAIKIIQYKLLAAHKLMQLYKKGVFNYFKHESIRITKHRTNLEKALFEANQYVYQLNIERNASGGNSMMGTTVAGCQLISDDIMLIFHIGDSRVYRFSNGKLDLLTKDHSALQIWYDEGCLGKRPTSNLISRALGPYPISEPEIQIIKVKKNDSFLICSDGLTDMLENDYIEKAIRGLNHETMTGCGRRLIDLALEQGGKDNISIVLLTPSQST